MELLRRIWKDPVWSKVIATVIIAFVLFAWPYLLFLLNLINSKTSIPNWLLISISLLIILVPFLDKKFISKYKFKIKAEKCIPKISNPRIDLLKSLIDKPQECSKKNSDAIYLKQKGYIEQIDTVSSNLYLLKINKTAKEVLVKHLKLKRKVKIIEFMAKITEDEKDFLRLFFIQVIPYGTSESGVTMEASIFSAGQKIARQKVINQIENSQKPEKLSYELTKDTAEYLEKFLFNSKPKRFKLDLDCNYIFVSHGSGGKAKGAWG